MLRLEKVSKFYTGNGLVSTGFSKVDLELNIGEFVAITGESGSGKSTLLNVISGLDSYEEGEMFIMGQPTSGFSQEDLEEYRKKYIGNIFQTFNLINSYTVYQNVELVLLMSGYEKKEVADKVTEIIEKVGLLKYINTKASKLSGGQKQRVAIARALAKETPIIVADEPTGNLDSKSAEGIIELLHQLSGEKLIVIVTHNYEQVEPYVTRKITMHDGQVVEDKKYNTGQRKAEREAEAKPAKAEPLLKKNIARLGIRNTFNIPAKFVLLLVVFMFMCSSVIAQYSTFLNQSDLMDGQGYNQFFMDTGKDRIIVTRKDKGEFTDKDYEKIKSIPNVNKVVENDLMLDTIANVANDAQDYYYTLKIKEIDGDNRTLEKGRMPENSNEAVIIYPNTNGYLSDTIDLSYGKKTFIMDNNRGTKLLKEKVKIVGYGYTSKQETESLEGENTYSEGYLLFSGKAVDEIRLAALEKYCTQEILFANKIIDANTGEGLYPLIPNKKVAEGKAFIPEEIAYSSGDNYVAGKSLEITNKSLYFKDKLKLTVANVYTKDNFEYYLGFKKFDENNGAIFVNPIDYNKIFDKGNFQSSVIVKDTKIAEETATSIEKAGFSTFYVKNGVISYSEGFDTIFNTFRVFMLVAILVVLFFISYFIVKLILKSRNVYYSTIRMLGATKENCKALLSVELFAVVNIAFFACMLFIGLVASGTINVNAYIMHIISFLKVTDYVILYIILCVMSLLISHRYSKQLFKKTAMKAYTEEV